MLATGPALLLVTTTVIQGAAMSTAICGLCWHSSSGRHLVIDLLVQRVDLSDEAGRRQVHVAAAGQAHGVQVADYAGGLVADDAPRAPVDQQRRRAPATIPWAADVVHLPVLQRDQPDRLSLRRLAAPRCAASQRKPQHAEVTAGKQARSCDWVSWRDLKVCGGTHACVSRRKTAC